jgi:oxygen-independent coproporphyrinogen III oxidase
MAGIYIHIPFCKQACHYCDFHFSVNQQVKTEMLAAISKEIVLQKDYLSDELIETVYFGGGTPSILSQAELSVMLDTLRSTHRIADHAEITVEANPDDLTLLRLKELRASGVNRLSIGIQSFDTAQLKFLNRVHECASAIKSFNDAREAGFDNISIDLIYAIPGETNEQWLDDIRQAIALNPEHISCYSLTIEDKTAFGKWAATGKLKPEPDEVSANHLETLMRELALAGYEHYEISNFSKPGFHSKHNSSYWKGSHYLGVGPSAHSYNGESRQYTISNNHAYLKAILAETVPFEKEILSRENKINEYILTSLRTSWGTDLEFLKQAHGHNLIEQNQSYINQLLDKRLITLENNILMLTQAGKLLADKISSDLFAS